MTETILTLWLASGAVISEPITPRDCAVAMSEAFDIGSDGMDFLVRDVGDGPEIITRISCGGLVALLPFPPSEVPCELEKDDA